ncbi:UDP-glucose:glycoprotein glucosyltransferase 1 [Pelomyxa schiedti]|nr:UDP-glucose:glycoprotein glucosyltransferase 1 [Pelomyxa schiedti]
MTMDRGLSLSFLALTVTLAAVVYADVPVTSSKDVVLHLTSSWKATPLLLEMGEAMARQGAFWKFAEALMDVKQAVGEEANNQYIRAIQVAKEVLNDDCKLSMLKQAMAMRKFSPSIEAYRHVEQASKQAVLSKNNTVWLEDSCWVLLENTAVFHIEELGTLLSTERPNGRPLLHEQLSSFGHLYGEPSTSTPTAILYCNIGTQQFIDFHNVLKTASQNGQITYLLRHLVTAGNGVVGGTDTPINIPGYGVEFALKSVEYKTINVEESEKQIQTDQEETLKDQENAKESSESPLGYEPLLPNNDFDKMSSSDLGALGLAAVSFISSSENPLAAMQYLSNNFPLVAISLARSKRNASALKTLFANQRHVSAGVNSLSINGLGVDPSHIDLFSLMEMVDEELQHVTEITSIGIPSSLALDLMQLGGPSDHNQPKIVFDINSDSITYINDLSRDMMYSRFARSVGALLRPNYPGQFYFIAKNLWTGVLVINPGNPDSLFISNVLYGFLSQMLPLRLGIVMAGLNMNSDVGGKCSGVECTLNIPNEPSPGVLVARAFHHLCDNTAGFLGLYFLSEVYQQFERSGKQLLTNDHVEAAWSTLAARQTIGSFHDAINSLEYDPKLASQEQFANEKGLTKFPLLFINGQQCTTDDRIGWELTQIIHDVDELQAFVQLGLIDDNTDIYKFLLSQPGTLSKYSKHVFGTKPNYVALTGKIVSGEGLSEQHSDLVEAKVNTLWNQIHFFHAPKTEYVEKTHTHLICADFGSMKGKEVASAALKNIDINTRVAFLDTGKTVPNTWHRLHLMDRSNSQDALDIVLGSDQEMSLAPEVVALHSLGRMFCEEVVGTTNTTYAVVANGKVIAFPSEEPLQPFDFNLLSTMDHMWASSVSKVLTDANLQYPVDPDILTADFHSTVLMKVLSVLSLDKNRKINRVNWNLTPSFTVVPKTEVYSRIYAVIDPLSKTGQRMGALINSLCSLLPVRADISLNPPTHFESLPLKSFYHYVFDPEIQFDESGKLLPINVAHISSLPSARLLTLGLDIPHSWITMPVEAKHDLDNIMLSDLGASETRLYAKFNLEHILVEGNCFEVVNEVPPRGLELELRGFSSDTVSADTLVMSNFGYFQLKASPAPWRLSIREGRSSRIFEMDDATLEKVVVLDSFIGKTLSLPVKKRPGEETTELLGDDETQEPEGSGFWDKISSVWSSKSEVPTQQLSNEDNRVHIFSLASGHLYERFLKIMMLSVVQHTNSTVKFWFIKNFLSPGFKDSIPSLAKHYGFEYELVTYKWPAWLFPQTEKMRLIWGYKVLFLDVLFPINLKKVIFMDSDQVARADMKELMELDLHGAPIGMTPFCYGENKREETAGFRFWDTGYWHEHLNGKPYHISALFVVDLVKFRKMAAGDMFRAHYDSLARDPNSLSNLDQDLPNYLQDYVPLYSLPPEWLYCETWCADSLKPHAKTIDLCNNPMTKTPKLDAAVHIIEEWRDLDNEIKQTEKALH